MQANRTSMFFALYGKEIRELLLEITVVVLLAMLINVLLFARSNHSPFPELLFVANFMLFGLACFMPFVSSFKLISREWRNNSIYMLLSLPAKGTLVLGAKLAALVTQFVVGTLVVGGSGLLLMRALMGLEFSQTLNEFGQATGLSTAQLFGEMFLVYLLGVAILIYLISISFSSQLAGKLVRRYSGLLTVVVFIALYSGMQKLMTLFWHKVDWHLSATLVNTDLFNQYLGIAILTFLTVSALLYAGSVFIYNRRIEL